MNTPLSKVTSVLYALLLINVKRLNHYQTIIDKSQDMELKIVFLTCAVQSQAFCNNLNRWLNEYHATPRVMVRKNFLTGILWRIREFLFTSARASLLHRSEGLDHSTLGFYHKVLTLSFMPLDVLQDLTKQAEELEKSCQNLKELHHHRLSELQMA